MSAYSSFSSFGHYVSPVPVNEPVYSYAPGSTERAGIEAALAAMAGEVRDLPLRIGGKWIGRSARRAVVMPHAHVLGAAH